MHDFPVQQTSFKIRCTVFIHCLAACSRESQASGGSIAHRHVQVQAPQNYDMKSETETRIERTETPPSKVDSNSGRSSCASTRVSASGRLIASALRCARHVRCRDVRWGEVPTCCCDDMCCTAEPAVCRRLKGAWHLTKRVSGIRLRLVQQRHVSLVENSTHTWHWLCYSAAACQRRRRCPPLLCW